MTEASGGLGRQTGPWNGPYSRGWNGDDTAGRMT